MASIIFIHALSKEATHERLNQERTVYKPLHVLKERLPSVKSVKLETK